MKTPREILLNRHQAAETKLNQIRREAVRVAADVNRRSSPVRELTFAATTLRPLAILWRELFLPARMTWASIAAVWVVILAVGLASRDPLPAREARRTAPPSPEVLRLLKQQERLLAELVERSNPRAAERPKDAPPRPWSQRNKECLNA